MKKNILILIGLLNAIFTFSQITTEEYDLLRGGIYGVSPHQNSMYRSNEKEIKDFYYTIYISDIIRKSDNKKIATEIVLNNKNIEYESIIIAHGASNEDINKMYIEDINKMSDKARKTLLTYVLILKYTD